MKSIQVTNNTYASAWRALVNRYDNKRVLIRNHVLALSSCKPLRSDSAIEIQNLIDELEQHRTQLSFLGQPVNQWDAWIVTLASQCLDLTSRQQWEEELSLAD